MRSLVERAMYLVALARAAFAGSCERQLLPELSFTLAGQNLEWPCQSTRGIYESTGRYVARNVIATRIQMYKEAVLVAMPRYRSGVPFSLGLASLKGREAQVSLRPFPSWPMQELGNCEAFQSVVDLVLDAQDILWVLDVGIVNTLEQPVRSCPPKVVAVNLKTEKVERTIDLGHLVSSNSRLQQLVVDQADDGGVFLYISDAATRAIIVHNVAIDKSYRVVLPRPVVEGCERKDVLYLALIRKSCGSQVLYFTYLGSDRLYKIKVTDLRKGSTAGCVIDVGRKENKIVILGTDNGCALFFRNKGQSDVYMWNTETSFKTDNFLLVQKGNECRLPTQVAPGYKRLMWVIESNFHDYIQNTVSCHGASVSLHPLVKSADY